MSNRTLSIGRKVRSFFGYKTMALYHRAHGENNDDLIDQLKANNVITKARVEQAMRKVDRKNYCSSDPYKDSPSYIGYSVNISAPHMHAVALENLEDKLVPGATCLDVGSGSGYLTACMSLMVAPNGKAYGVEHIKELTEIATKNINKDQPGLLESGRVVLVFGDGRKGLQLNESIQFDAIHVGAAAAEIPQALIDQLKPNGRMIIPVGKEGGEQFLEQIDKLPDGRVERSVKMGVRYVPLTDASLQYDKTKHR